MLTMKTSTLLMTAPIPLLTDWSPSLMNSGINFLKAVSFPQFHCVFTLILLYCAEYIVTHAPIAPWLTDDTSVYPSGAYHAVAESVGGVVDWWNIQFYNQGSDYTTCDEMLTQSSSDYPHTSIFEINQCSNIPLSNLLIGKPAGAADASTGYMDPNTLAGCLQQGQSAGWNGGAMLWEYPDATPELITTIRSQSFPV
jgi:chitinase